MLPHPRLRAIVLSLVCALPAHAALAADAKKDAAADDAPAVALDDVVVTGTRTPHRLDDSRLVSAALLVGRGKDGGKTVFDVNDPLIPSLDVMAVNTYNGWYTDDALASLPDAARGHRR